MKTKNKQDQYEERKKRFEENLKRLDRCLNEKDYLITVCEVGNSLVSGGDREREVSPRRYYYPASLKEIAEVINQGTFWRSDDLKRGVPAKDIAYEDKQWGMNVSITVEPLSEELEKSYLNASKEDFFKLQRLILEHENKRKVC